MGLTSTAGAPLVLRAHRIMHCVFIVSTHFCGNSALHRCAQRHPVTERA